MERKELLDALESMPGRLRSAVEGFTAEEAARPGAGGSFSAVELCWHLADYEAECATRLERVLKEDDPFLPDFDGLAVARERNYARLPLQGGVQALEGRRRANVAFLRALDASGWGRPATQQALGAITLGRLPEMMAAHDEEHWQELVRWLDRREILRAIDAFAGAYAAGDLNALASYYADDLLKLRQGAAEETRAQVVARVQGALSLARGRVEVDNQELEIEGDMAYTRGVFTVTLTPKDGGEPQRFTRRYLEIWRKRDGRWRVCRAIDNAPP